MGAQPDRRRERLARAVKRLVALGIAGAAVLVTLFLFLGVAQRRFGGRLLEAPPRGPDRLVGRNEPSGDRESTHRPSKHAPAGGTEGRFAKDPAQARGWQEFLKGQRAMLERLRSAKVVKAAGVWKDRTIGERVRALEADAGVPITWDPTVAHRAGDRSAPNMGTGDGVRVLDFAYEFADINGLSLRVTPAGLEIVAFVYEGDPASVARYEEDPLGAFWTARYLARDDRGFYRRWRSIEEAEGTQVEIDVDKEFHSLNDLCMEIWRSARAPIVAADWSAGEPPFVSGLRRGTLRDVLQSWSPGATVVTGRGGMEVWRDGRRADASATDKREYEEFRFRLAETPFRSLSGDVSLREIAAAVTQSTGAKALLDPEAAGLLTRPTPTATLLDVLEQEAERKKLRFVWTWASGIFVITGPGPKNMSDFVQDSR